MGGNMKKAKKVGKCLLQVLCDHPTNFGKDPFANVNKKMEKVYQNIKATSTGYTMGGPSNAEAQASSSASPALNPMQLPRRSTTRDVGTQTTPPRTRDVGTQTSPPRSSFVQPTRSSSQSYGEGPSNYQSYGGHGSNYASTSWDSGYSGYNTTANISGGGGYTGYNPEPRNEADGSATAYLILIIVILAVFLYLRSLG